MRKFNRKAPIYLPRDEADGVLLLASGRVKICHVSPEGKQSILAFIEAGELFGELAIFENGQREEYAEAVETATAILIPAAEIRQLMAEDPKLSLGVTKLIGMRRQRVERRLKYLLFHSNRDRLVHLLLELAERYGKPTPDGLDLGIRLSHQDLGAVIGSTRETVSITLGELQAEGYLEIGRRRLVLKDLERLAKSVNVPTPTLNLAKARENVLRKPQIGAAIGSVLRHPY
ncbi:MAG: Crp/Fnr family transcriptional regulator [Pirellulales bacterium]|nr:Crp/Fnr family transcriptional regulator [Pirellulales bacterium]